MLEPLGDRARQRQLIEEGAWSPLFGGGLRALAQPVIEKLGLVEREGPPTGEKIRVQRPQQLCLVYALTPCDFVGRDRRNERVGAIEQVALVRVSFATAR